MRREIPQKVNPFYSARQINSVLREGTTLRRRTRSASILGFALTAGALGGLSSHTGALAAVSRDVRSLTASQSPQAVMPTSSSGAFSQEIAVAPLSGSPAWASDLAVFSAPAPWQAELIPQGRANSSVFTRNPATLEALHASVSAPNFQASGSSATTAALGPEAPLVEFEAAASTEKLAASSLVGGMFTLTATALLTQADAVQFDTPTFSTANFSLSADLPSDTDLSEPAPLDESLLASVTEPGAAEATVAEVPELFAMQASSSDAALEQLMPQGSGNQPELEDRVHQVQPGESLSQIGKAYQVDPSAIAKRNQIDNPDVIEPSESLVIPSSQLSLELPLEGELKLASIAASDQGIAAVLLAPKGQSRINSSTVPNSTGANSTMPQIAVTSTGDTDKLVPELDAAMPPSQPSLPIEPLALLPTNTTQDQRKLPLSSPIARRGTFPVIPSLDLPPLSSAENFLPAGMGGIAQYIWPAKGVLTSGYGWRWGRMHRGIDIAAPVGTTVVASAPGVVVTAGWNSGGFGNLVEIRHPDGSLTVYAHNNRISTRVGSIVSQGEKIAEMGSTGRSTGPHTHFELHPAGKGAVNPMSFLTRG